MPSTGTKSLNSMAGKSYEWPEMADDSDGTHYIGIMPGEGEFGQLVWLVDATEGDNNTPAEWYVWTYQDLRKQNLTLPVATTSNIIWYRDSDHDKAKA